MPRILAIYDGDTIANTIVGHPDNFPQYEDVTDLVPQPGIGWRKVNGVHVSPESKPEPIPAPPTKMTTLAFENRFTDDESTNIEIAALDNPRETMDARRSAARLRVAIRKSIKAGHIDPKRQDTRNYVALLAASGLLTSPVKEPALYPDRATEILDAPITDEEAFRG